MPDVSESQLVAQYLAGDENALEILIARHLKIVYAFIFRFLNNPSDAEDVTQETFIKVWKNIKKFKPDKNFKTWILSIAKNACFDFLRKKRPLLFSELNRKNDEDKDFIDTIADETPLPPEIVDKELSAQELTKLLEKLSAQQRLVILLHFQDGLTFQEIGQITHEPLNTVKSRHRRALLALKKFLTEG